MGSEDLLDRYDEDDAAENYYSMRLRHALPTAQGIFEAFEGRWVYALDRDPHAPFGIGDAPILPGFESAQDAVDDFACEAAEFTKAACEADLPLYAHLVTLFMGGSMPPPMHSVRIHETCSLNQCMPAGARAVLRGVSTLKIKFDPEGSLEHSLKMLTRMVDTHPDLSLRVDLGGMLTDVLELGQDPLELLEEFAALKVEYLEDPVRADLIDLLPQDVVPLGLDLVSTSYTRILEAVDRGLIDVLILKPQLCGSFGRAFALARTRQRLPQCSPPKPCRLCPGDDAPGGSPS